MPTKSIHVHTQLHCCFPYKPFTLAGFEPGSSVLQADGMTTSPRLIEGLTRVA
jgi:hypothetical protein